MSKMEQHLDATLEQILELARWAPSGDNTQPWRFEILGARRLVVHGHDTRDHCVYDLDGHPSQISIGALLETMAIAASTFQLEMRSMRHLEAAEDRPTISVEFVPAPGLPADPLADVILARSVQRRPLSRRPLTAPEKSALAAALPTGFQVLWLEGAQRAATARLMFRNAKLRLTMPEAHQAHVAIIEWNARYSEDRIPDQALGVDAMTARLMRWIMRDWRPREILQHLAGGHRGAAPADGLAARPGLRRAFRAGRAAPAAAHRRLPRRRSRHAALLADGHRARPAIAAGIDAADFFALRARGARVFPAHPACRNRPPRCRARRPRWWASMRGTLRCSWDASARANRRRRARCGGRCARC
jgi:hypothetical protein